MANEDVVYGRGVTLRTIETMRDCGICGRSTKHRITTVVMSHGDVTNEIVRCLEHDEE